ILRLQELAKGGVGKAQLFSRYLNPMKQETDYRAIKLGTTAAPVRLYFVDESGVLHNNLQVRVSPNSFSVSDTIRDQGVTRDGKFETTNSYKKIAFVRTLSGERLLAQIPVEVIENHVSTIVLRPVAGGEELAQLEADARTCRRRLEEILNRLIENNRQLRELLAEAKNQMALVRVRATAAMVESELPRQVTELARLKEAAAKRSGTRLPFDECDRMVRTIEDRAKTLS